MASRDYTHLQHWDGPVLPIAAVYYDLSESDVGTLQSEGIKVVRLGSNFDRFVENESPTANVLEI